MANRVAMQIPKTNYLTFFNDDTIVGEKAKFRPWVIFLTEHSMVRYALTKAIDLDPEMLGDLYRTAVFTISAVSAVTSFKIHHDKSPFSGKSVLYLNRHQTEEWKGWMQVLFLMYHYFAASEIYNAIRIFIAAYVWMTGFRNFSYYYIRRDSV